MTKIERVKIIDSDQEKRKLLKFSRSLEAKAKEIVQHCTNAEETPSPTNSINSEIALTLEEIERWQQLHEDLNRRLLRSECYVETECMQMEERMPRYSHYRFAERHKFHGQLRMIEVERRKLIVTHEERMQLAHGRLSVLLNKHAHLN